MNSRCALCVLVLALAGAAVTPVACRSSGDMVSKAMSSLPSSIKDSANSYISKYTDVNKLLGNVTNSSQAREMRLPRLDQMIGSMEGDARALNTAPSDVRKNVNTAFGSQLDGLTKGWNNNLNRLLGNNDISSVLKPAVDRLPKLSL